MGLAIAIYKESYISYPIWVQDASSMLIFLNLFNLLPIYPLDGGQIAELLVFYRLPYIGVLFKIIGIALLVMMGMTEPILLTFAILIAFTIHSGDNLLLKPVNFISECFALFFAEIFKKKS